MPTFFFFAILTLLIIGFHDPGFTKPTPAGATKTVDDIIQLHGQQASARLSPYFERLGITFPPERISFVAFKEEKKMLLLAQERNTFHLIKAYPILAASGKLGPKLREGDFQVPEGIYSILWLNPNSSYHLSMKLNYPNSFDKKYAKLEGRVEPGTDIFIHGKAVSAGCLAMGDKAIEELFYLVHHVGKENVEVILAPMNLRKRDATHLLPQKPPWVTQLYDILRARLEHLGL